MKGFLRSAAAGALLFSVAARAADSLGSVFETGLRIANPSRDARADYEVNLKSPELGRAWLSVSYTDADPGDNLGQLGRSVDVKVPGLSYDPVNHEIVYKRNDGSSVVCADDVRKSLWLGIAYRDTGRCAIRLDNSILRLDDGFYLRSERGVRLSLQVEGGKGN